MGLPLHLLARTLKFVDEPARLGSCALVRHSWNTAAAAASPSIQMSVEGDQQARADALQQWLLRGSNAAHVMHMAAAARYQPYQPRLVAYQPLQLPFQRLHNLQSLDLKYIALQPPQDPGTPSSATASRSASLCRNVPSYGASSASSNPFASAATSLSELRLKCVDLSAFPGSYSSLSAFTALQHLEIYFHMEFDFFRKLQERDRNAQMCAGLSQLRQLSSLDIHGFGDAWLLPAAIGALQQLQDLRLGWELQGLQAGVFAQLPVSLTSLEVCDFGCFSSNSTPHVSQLTALQHLSLRTVGGCDTSWLGELPSAKGLTNVALDTSHKPSSITALLRALAQLPQLQHLHLRCSDPKSVGHARLKKDACVALFTLPHLTHLVLEDIELKPKAITAAAKRITAAAKPQEHQLRVLSFQFDEFAAEPDIVEWFEPEDLPSLVRCFPQLQRLDITHCLPEDDESNIAALLQLTGLNRLSIDCGFNVGTDETAANVLAHMTGLKHLRLWSCDPLTVRGLLALIQLTGLTCLCAVGMSTGGWSHGSLPGGLLNNADGLTSTVSATDISRVAAQAVFRVPPAVCTLHP